METASSTGVVACATMCTLFICSVGVGAIKFGASSVVAATSSPFVIVENAEGPGLSFAWKEPSVVTPGNGINPDFLTSYMPDRFPHAWGAETYGVEINVVGGAGVREHLDAPLSALRASFSVMAVRCEMRSGADVTVAVAKHTHNQGPKEEVLWATYIFQTSSGPRLIVVFGINTSQQISYSMPVSLWQVVDVVIDYDGVARTYIVSLNGAIGQGILPASSPTTAEWMFLGASASSTGTGVIYFVDNYTLEDLSW